MKVNRRFGGVYRLHFQGRVRRANSAGCLLCAGFLLCMACSMRRREEEGVQVLVREPGGKRPLVSRRCRWEDNYSHLCQGLPISIISILISDNIKMDLREIRWGCMDWIHVAHDRDHWQFLCEHCNELFMCLKMLVKFFSTWATGSISRRTQPEGRGFKFRWGGFF
jgi:hypothetical protein